MAAEPCLAQPLGIQDPPDWTLLLSNGKVIRFHGNQGLGFLPWGSGQWEIPSLGLCDLGTPHPLGLEPKVTARP